MGSLISGLHAESQKYLGSLFKGVLQMSLSLYLSLFFNDHFLSHHQSDLMSKGELLTRPSKMEVYHCIRRNIMI